jgi:hypothetical protein
MIALVAALAFPAAAAAKGHSQTIAPPGVSGVQQYVETVPTAHGGQPTSSVHGGAGPGHPGGGGGITGGGGSGTSSGGSSGAVPSSTQRALAAQGADGRAAAALAAATAPSNPHRGAGTASGRGLSSSVSSVSRATSTSPVSAIFKALTGSSSSGGLGALLPIILIACLLGFSALAIVRRRRTTT